MRLINCPNCGHRCSDQNTYCPECGFELNTFFSDHPNKKNKHLRTILVTIGLCFAVAIIICLSIFILSHRINVPTNTQNLAENSTPSDEIKQPEKSDVSEIPTPGAINNEASNNNIDKTTVITTSTISPSTETPQNNSSDNDLNETVAGVYSGNDHEILVLNSDGLAYYYCISIEFTELQCPWYTEENRVYVELARLHCTIYADISEKDLIFKSDSLNWNPEIFTKINVSPDDYLTRALSTYDSNAVLNYDGTISYTLNGITYTLPKTFVDYEDDYDHYDYCSIFIDSDVQSDYSSSILFYSDTEGAISSSSELSSVTNFASSFYDNVSVTLNSESTVDDNPARIYDITGYLNKGFMNIQNTAISGYIVVFQNKLSGKKNVIMFIQSSDRKYDNSKAFLDMLHTAN